MLKKISLDDVNKFFIADPKLCLMGLQDSDLVSLHKYQSIQEREGSVWYEIRFLKELLAVVRMEPHSLEAVTVHLYVATRHQGKKLLKYMATDVIEYLTHNTDYEKIIVPIPSPCKHVIRTMKPLGFKLEGCLSKALNWRNHKVDLLWYARNIRYGAAA